MGQNDFPQVDDFVYLRIHQFELSLLNTIACGLFELKGSTT